MTKFSFCQDRKIITWERTHFTINASTRQEAEVILRNLNPKGVIYDEESDKVVILNSEINYESMSDLTPAENAGRATIQTYDESGKLLFDNMI